MSDLVYCSKKFRCQTMKVKPYIILNTPRKHVNYEDDKNKVLMNKPYNIQNTNICNGIFHISFSLINEGETTRSERKSGRNDSRGERDSGRNDPDSLYSILLSAGMATRSLTILKSICSFLLSFSGCNQIGLHFELHPLQCWPQFQNKSNKGSLSIMYGSVAIGNACVVWNIIYVIMSVTELSRRFGHKPVRPYTDSSIDQFGDSRFGHSRFGHTFYNEIYT